MRQFCAVLVAITIGILPGWTLAEAQQVLQVPPGSRVTASLEGNTAVITVIGAQPGESPAQSPVDVSDLAAPPGAEDILGVSTDPETGITTIVRRNPDGTTTASAAQRVLLPDGSELLMEIGENGEIRETRIAPNGEFSTTITKGKDQTTAAVTDSESIHVLESDRDGSTHTRRDADGTIVHEQRNAAGELQETVTERADGWVEEQEPNGNVRTTYTNPTDGTTTVIEVDEDGNTRTTVTDRAGKVVRNDVQQVTEPEPGRRYFEEVLNGTDWDDLPKSLKNRYADSEHDIRQRETARAQEEAEAAKKRLEDEQRAAESRTVTEEMEKSFAALRTEEEEAAQRSAERRAEDERRQKIAESREKTRELREQHAAALARGDQREATRLSHLMDEHHEASMELLQATESEEREMNRLAEIRQRLASQVFNRASAAAEQQIGIDQADQDAKDAITSKTKWVSIGSQMQQETSATTRMADRERAYAEAKQAEIDRMLNHDKLTSAERKILSEMRELGVVQEEGAERLLSDNANITAAGYVLDGVLTVTGGKLIEGGRRLAVGAANRALSREVAKKVISVTAERGVIDVAGAGITRAATATTERLVSEKAAATVGRVLGTDVSTPAAQFAERAARRVLGDRAVEAVASGATRVAEVATTDVVELVRGRTGSEATATTAAREAAAAREATATTPRQPAPRQPAPRETPPPARESSVAKKPSDMNAAERQAYNDAKADEAVRRALDERPAANTADDLAGHEVTAKTERVKRPSEMTPAERQAYNDRMANRAIRERRGSSPDLDDELLPGPVETPSNRPFTREEVEALHDPREDSLKRS